MNRDDKIKVLTESDTNTLDGTPEQLADALIKAVGKWKD